jgi:hypothetical protein
MLAAVHIRTQGPRLRAPSRRSRRPDKRSCPPAPWTHPWTGVLRVPISKRCGSRSDHLMQPDPILIPAAYKPIGAGRKAVTAGRKAVTAGRKAVTAGRPPAPAAMFSGADADAGVVNGRTRGVVRLSKAAGRSDTT